MRRNASMYAALALALASPVALEAARLLSRRDPLDPLPPRKPRVLTDSDRENIAAAQRKRERRALRMKP